MINLLGHHDKQSQWRLSCKDIKSLFGLIEPFLPLLYQKQVLIVKTFVLFAFIILNSLELLNMSDNSELF